MNLIPAWQAKFLLHAHVASGALLPSIGLALLLTAVDVIAVPAGIETTQSLPIQDDAVRPELLLLEVMVNGQRLGGITYAEYHSDMGLLIPDASWREARLAPLSQPHALTDGRPAFHLDAVPGLFYRLDRQRLILEIDAPPHAFVPAVLRASIPRAESAPQRQPGATLNYDLALTYSGQAVPVASGAILEASVFGSLGHLVTSGVVRKEAGHRTVQRLATFWRYDMPHRMETVLLGDMIGTGGAWSRPVRYGGIRWGRDFEMRPGFVTQPQLTLDGEAALPSTVDVMVNNTQRQSRRVEPGPFELIDVPIVNGANEVSLVVRDLLGRETVVRQSYYASPRLLAKGTSDFSLEAGWLRTGYGQDGQYGPGFAAGTLRLGITPDTTVEMRMEAQSRRLAGGAELAGLLGNLGVGWLALAISETDMLERRQGGGLIRAGMERQTPKGGVSLQYEQASEHFSPFGEAANATAVQRVRQRWMVGTGGTVSSNMSVGMNYVKQRQWDGRQVQAVNVSTSLPLWQRANANLSVHKQFGDRRDWYASLIISVPLGARTSSAMRISQGSGGEGTGTVSLARPAPTGPGWGWRMETSSIHAQRIRAGLQYHNNVSEWNLDGVTDSDGRARTARVGAKGAVGLFAGIPFASRPLGPRGFAVVEVPGMKDLPIKHQHQVVAHTDARGMAFIPNLQPWRQNRIEVDPSSLPLDASVDDAVQEVAPYPRSGSLVRFRIQRTTQSLLALHRPDGRPVPLHARVRVQPHGQEFIVGQRGEVWLAGVEAGRRRLQVRWNGDGCDLDVILPVNTNDRPEKIGPVTCGEKLR